MVQMGHAKALCCIILFAEGLHRTWPLDVFHQKVSEGRLDGLKEAKSEKDDISDDGGKYFPKTPGFISISINPYLGDTNDQNQETPAFQKQSQFSEYFARPKDDFKAEESNMKLLIKNKRVYLEKSPEKLAVPRSKLALFPYHNVVKISSGCTGTLLTPSHVLTAAHCVHDGFEFKQNMEMLKIEVTDTIGYRIHYIVKINVPVMWLKIQMLPEIGRGAFDYAVLHLNIPVNGRDKFMQFSLPTVKALNSNIEYIGFTQGKSGALWHSTCDSTENILFMRGNLVFRKCQSSPGNSGSAAFTNNAVDGNKIIGVLSNTVSAENSPTRGKNTDLESIMLLTLPKCLDICAMIHPDGENYAICETIKQNNVEYLQVGSTRIMPFFG